MADRTKPVTRKWIYTIPVEGGEMEAEIWTGSMSAAEVRGVVALTHKLPESKVRVRRG